MKQVATRIYERFSWTHVNFFFKEATVGKSFRATTLSESAIYLWSDNISAKKDDLLAQVPCQFHVVQTPRRYPDHDNATVIT